MLGERVPRQVSLRDMALPYLEDLYEVTHENVNLGVLHGVDVLYLARVQGHRSSDVILRVGDTLPAHSTSTGKALLAHAPRETVQQVLDAGLTRLTPRTVVLPGMFLRQLKGIAEQGYAVNDEETHTGVVSVALRCSTSHGVAVAAISVTGKAGRVDPHRLAPAVRTATLALGRRLIQQPTSPTSRSGSAQPSVPNGSIGTSTSSGGSVRRCAAPARAARSSADSTRTPETPKDSRQRGPVDPRATEVHPDEAVGARRRASGRGSA